MAIKLQGTNSAAAPGLTNDGGDGVVVGTDSVEISTGGTSRVKVDSEGRVLTGGQTTSVADASSLHSDIQSHSADGNGLSIGRYSANAYEPYITFFKSRNTTIGSNASAVTDNDWLGNTNYYGATGSAWKHAAYQAVLIDGSVGGADDSMPAEFQWHNRDATALNHNMSIRSSGDLEVKRGNVVIGTSGKGIDFSATSDATGKTSELLDDYEEGTFTPAYIGGVDAGFGYGNQDGTYVKIGKMVYWDIYINGSSGSSNGNHLAISGFPFTQSNVNARGTATFGYHQYAGDYHLLHQPANTYLYFYDGSSSVTGNTALATGDAAHISGSYQAA